MEQIYLERYAEIMLWGLRRGRGAPLRKGALVQVRFDLKGVRLAEEICALLHDVGHVPLPTLLPTARMEHDFYFRAAPRRLGVLRPGDEDLYQALSGSITVLAPESLTHLVGVDSARLGIAQHARAPLVTLLRQREINREYGWTLCLMPTLELAHWADMSLAEYTEQIVRACYLDADDPILEWKRLAREVDSLCKRLNRLGNARLHVEAKGTDLFLNVGEQRRWVGISGRNIPSFEIYVSPDWRTVEGAFRADLASFRMGEVVEDARLAFSKGELTKIRARAGGPFARGQTNIDAGAARVGEFALVDRRFSRISRFMATTLYDENHGGQHGSLHIALGQSYANTHAGDPAEFTPKLAVAKGFNTSTLHWDLVGTLPRQVSVIAPRKKDQIIYENGEFVL